MGRKQPSVRSCTVSQERSFIAVFIHGQGAGWKFRPRPHGTSFSCNGNLEVEPTGPCVSSRAIDGFGGKRGSGCLPLCRKLPSELPGPDGGGETMGGSEITVRVPLVTKKCFSYGSDKPAKPEGSELSEAHEKVRDSHRAESYESGDRSDVCGGHGFVGQAYLSGF